jgi:hypothetical protein
LTVLKSTLLTRCDRNEDVLMTRAGASGVAVARSMGRRSFVR